VKNSTKISGNMGGLTSFLSFEGYFGVSAAGIGDLDKDGITDMAVGSHRWDEGATDAGSLWILFMNSNGTVKSHYRIDNSSGDIPEHLSSATLFGTSVDYANDIDGDGVGDILVGALGDDDQGSNSGAIWVLLMNENGTVGNAYKVNGVQGNTDITLGAGDYFGTSVAYLGMKDGLLNLAIGAMRADEGGIDRGVVWIPGTFVCPDLSADAGTDQTFCDGRTIINLDAVPVDKGFGRWSKLEADGNVEDQYSPQSTVSGLGAGEHNFVWTVTYSQNCPSETDEVKVIIEPELSAGEDLFLCEGGTTAMNGSEVGSGNGLWEIVSGEGTFLDPSDPHTNIEVHHDATLRWTIQSSYCPESSDEVNISVWDVEPDAGPDQILCDERRETYLHALAPEKGTGQWSLVSSDAVVGDLHAPQTSVSNLSPGEHIIAWTVSLTACPTKVDTVKIFKEQPAVAGPDTVLCEGRTALLNASDPGQGTGLWEVIKGQATFTDANHPRTEAFFHTDSVTLKWTLQSQYCSGVSDEMQVRIWEIDESKFYNVITPGDGVEMNEVWLVQNLEDLPGQKELRIFNRWGNLVYAAENYQNDWDAAGLSAGEYYYHMSLSSCAKEVKGWIHVIK